MKLKMLIILFVSLFALLLLITPNSTRIQAFFEDYNMNGIADDDELIDEDTNKNIKDNQTQTNNQTKDNKNTSDVIHVQYKMPTLNTVAAYIAIPAAATVSPSSLIQYNQIISNGKKAKSEYYKNLSDQNRQCIDLINSDFKYKYKAWECISNRLVSMNETGITIRKSKSLPDPPNTSILPLTPEEKKEIMICSDNCLKTIIEYDAVERHAKMDSFENSLPDSLAIITTGGLGRIQQFRNLKIINNPFQNTFVKEGGKIFTGDLVKSTASAYLEQNNVSNNTSITENIKTKMIEEYSNPLNVALKIADGASSAFGSQLSDDFRNGVNNANRYLLKWSDIINTYYKPARNVLDVLSIMGVKPNNPFEQQKQNNTDMNKPNNTDMNNRWIVNNVNKDNTQNIKIQQNILQDIINNFPNGKIVTEEKNNVTYYYYMLPDKNFDKISNSHNNNSDSSLNKAKNKSKNKSSKKSSNSANGNNSADSSKSKSSPSDSSNKNTSSSNTVTKASSENIQNIAKAAKSGNISNLSITEKAIMASRL